MMNAIVPQDFGQLSTRFAGQQATPDNDLSAGVQTSYGILGYRGKVWSIRFRGTETQLMRDDGDGPRNSVEVVLLKASTHIAKIFYKNGYVEGSTDAPDCFSTNGLVPDASVQNKLSPTCAACPMNAWGSRVTQAGKQGKACSDSKRVAIVPVSDIANEAFGGPMLLRIPAASLQELAGYGNKLGQLGYPYFAVATRISFDPAEAYPKFTFSAIRPLTDAEADAVLSLRENQHVARVLSDAVDGTAPAAQIAAPVTAASVFEQPPPSATQTTAPAPVQQPVVVQPAVQQPVVAQGVAPKPAMQSTGFGPVASAPSPQPVVQQAPVQQAPVQQAPVQQAPAQTEMPMMPDPATAAGGTSLAEAELSAQLDALLG